MRIFVADMERFDEKGKITLHPETISKWLRFTWILKPNSQAQSASDCSEYVCVLFRLPFPFWHSYREIYRETPLTTAWFIANATIKLVIVLCSYVYVCICLPPSVCECVFVFMLILLNPIELHSFRSIFNAFFCIKININKHKINSKMRQTSRKEKKRNNVYRRQKGKKCWVHLKVKVWEMWYALQRHTSGVILYEMFDLIWEWEHSDTHTQIHPTFWTEQWWNICVRVRALCVPLCLSIFGII